MTENDKNIYVNINDNERFKNDTRLESIREEGKDSYSSIKDLFVDEATSK